MKRIIDVSEFQGDIDWKKVTTDGISGAIIRCGLTGYGVAKNKYTDKMFEANYAAATAAGLPVGVYYYSCATTEAEATEEAAQVIKLLTGKTLQMPVYWDTEDNHNTAEACASPQNQRTIGKAQLTKCANAFLNAIRAAGYGAGIYGSTSWLANQLDMPSVKADSIWVAQYYKECQYHETAYDMWQYTSSGTVAGISGRVDISECYADYTEKPADEKKAVGVLAKEVLAGKWGNGSDRKSKLAAAGYDYTTVQQAVNALLHGTQPAKPASKKSVEEIAKEVLRGAWGNGALRRKKLEAAGYNYKEVQAAVNKLL